MKEIWKPIENYIGEYEISNLGRVRSLSRTIIYKDGREKNIEEKILKPYKNNQGYLYVNLSKNSIIERCYIHRLVGFAFVDGWFEGASIDHIDTNPLNNCAWNLKWVTHTENMNNPLTKKHLSECRIGENNHNSIKVAQLSLDGELIKIWDSMGMAENEGYNSVGISKCCRNIKKTSKGFRWMLYEDYINMTEEDIENKIKEDNIHKLSVKVVQLNKNTNELIEIWDSMMDAHRTGIYDVRHISNCCKGNRKTHKGFKWMYYDEWLKIIN